jgi:transposase
MQKLQITSYRVEELESYLKSCKDKTQKLRLMACIQIAKGASSRDLKEVYHHSHSQYCAWVKRLNESGIEGLKDKAKPGRRAKLSLEQWQQIKQMMLSESAEQHGYNSSTWTAAMLIDYIQKQYQVGYKQAAIYVILKQKLGLSYQKGKGFYPEALAERQQVFVEDLKKDLAQ